MKIGVTAHVSRVRQADKLIRTIKADAVSIDRGYYGPQVNHHRTWARMAEITGPHEWAVVLEDDALPCNDFRGQAERALDTLESESSLVSFYLGQSRPIHWQDRVGHAVAKANVNDASWIVGDAALHGVAIGMRGSIIHDMLDEVTRDTVTPIDEAVTRWARKNYIPCWYSWPSIVQHADGDTIVKHRDGARREKGRVAWQFGSREIWTKRAVTL